MDLILPGKDGKESSNQDKSREEDGGGEGGGGHRGVYSSRKLGFL